MSESPSPTLQPASSSTSKLWTTLSRDGHELPVTVRDRWIWYDKQIRRQRAMFYGLEAFVIVVSAAIPIATVLGASTAVAGVLGAIVTLIVSLRQLLRSRENWVRYSATRALLEREIVAWQYGMPPYNTGDPDGALASSVEEAVVQETSQWTNLRNQQAQSRSS